MKIVHSFWTKPTFKKKNLHVEDRNKGGWLDSKSNYMSWALSALQFRKYYDQVELVTDELGKHILIDQLQLPYTSVKVVLDKINGYHTDLWALGKIYAYSIQDEPFIHVDGDVYIWGKFPERIQNAQLVAQNFELDNLYYKLIFNKIKESYRYIPATLYKSKQKNGGINAINAGIIGGMNYPFFKEYCKQAFEFVDKNYDDLDKMGIGFFNVIFEQALFYAMADEKEIPVSCLKDYVNESFDGLAEFTGVPQKTKYIHTVGSYKKSKDILNHLNRRMQIDYPDYYYRILNLLKTYQF